MVNAAKLPFAIKNAMVKLLSEHANVTKHLVTTFGAKKGKTTLPKIRKPPVLRLHVVEITDLPTLRSPGKITRIMTGTSNVMRDKSIA